MVMVSDMARSFLRLVYLYAASNGVSGDGHLFRRRHWTSGQISLVAA
tara:strand:- start:23 stop:163 length:141 start_codon:yes stop_codon:yes gene_type:complete